MLHMKKVHNVSEVHSVEMRAPASEEQRAFDGVQEFWSNGRSAGVGRATKV